MTADTEKTTPPFTRHDARPYRKGDIEGECMGLVAGMDLADLPWDTAPRQPRRGAPDEGIFCVKRSRHRCVLTKQIPGKAGPSIRLYIKRCKPSRSLLKQWGTIGRKSKSQREWELGWDLMERDIPTAFPLLWADRRISGQIKATYFISRGIEDAVSFFALQSKEPEASQRMDWMARLGAFIRMSHDRGFAHNDLSCEHVLVSSDPAAPPLFTFIDLDGSRVYQKALSPYRRAHNFFQIFRSLPDNTLSENYRRAFYDGYFQGQGNDATIARYEKAIRLIRFQKQLGKAFNTHKWFKK